MAPANRDDAYDDLHTELLGFSTLPAIACNAVPSENYEACQSASSDLVAATFDYDTALSELSTSNSQLDANILNSIQGARDSLSAIEGTLDSFKSAAQQAAINYQNASAAAVDQLIDLEAEKQELIEAMEDAELQASMADSEYQNQKNLRIQEYETNKPIWEESLAQSKNQVFNYTQLERYYSDSLINLNEEVKKWTDLFDILKFEEEALLDEVKKYENLIEKIENKLESLADEPEEIEEEIENLEEEIKALLEKLKEAEKEKSKLDSPI
jgi:chromosome segregation ATPase